MAESVVLALGRTGIVTGDLGLRLYRNGIASPSEVGGVSLVMLDRPTDYKLVGLPDDRGDAVSATWEVDGVAGSYDYPPRAGTPAGMIIPARRDGLTAGAISLRAYIDGVLDTADTLVLGPGLGAPADYYATGWPIQRQGRRWVLLYEIDGFTQTRSWIEAPGPALPDTRTQILNFVLANYSASPVVESGQDFDPMNPLGPWPASGPFAVVSTSMFNAAQKTAGGKDALSLQEWGVYARCHGRQGRGVAEPWGLALSMGALLKAEEIDGLVLTVPAIRDMGEQGGSFGVWHQVEMTIRGLRPARGA